MLSIQEIKLLLEKLERLEQEDWKKFVTEYKSKLQELAYAVDAYNSKQIDQLDKTKDWYQQDIEWRHQRKEMLKDHKLDEQINLKINQFAKMGNNLQNCLEIGPGYGHYTRMLLPWRLVFLVDVLQSCQSKIFKLFNPKHHKYLRFYTTDRTACADIPNNSCNFVFSWNTFPFFTQEHIAQYLVDINRVLLPGGYGLIHYADCNYDKDLHEAKRGYWNFNTKEAMSKMLKAQGFEIEELSQFSPGNNYVIFKKPGNQNPVVYKVIEIPAEK